MVRVTLKVARLYDFTNRPCNNEAPFLSEEGGFGRLGKTAVQVGLYMSNLDGDEGRDWLSRKPESHPPCVVQTFRYPMSWSVEVQFAARVPAPQGATQPGKRTQGAVLS